MYGYRMCTHGMVKSEDGEASPRPLQLIPISICSSCQGVLHPGQDLAHKRVLRHFSAHSEEVTMQCKKSVLAIVASACVLLDSGPIGAQTTYTSPIEVTGGSFVFLAAAPDRDTGVMTSRPLPPGFSGPLDTLTGSPINAQFDKVWNGTPAQIAAGTSPRQQSCDGPDGVKMTLGPHLPHDYSPYSISCNFGTAGNVFVKQEGSDLLLSYQIFNNTVSFRTRSPFPTCSPGQGSPICPNDPSFTARFAIEVLTRVHAKTLCTLRAEPSQVYLHAVAVENHNAAASIGHAVDMYFLSDRFLSAELAMQAQTRTVPFSLDSALAAIRSDPACAGSGIQAAVAALFPSLEVDVGLPAGITFKAIHPPIEPPTIPSLSLPYGDDTCKTGFVWRNAYYGDHVCVVPSVRTQAQADNAAAGSHRTPNGGRYGTATCLSGFVWREARPGDLVCVTPAVRAQALADNAQAASRRVLGPTAPSFILPLLSAPPIAQAGANVFVTGKFFPQTIDPTRIDILFDRTHTASCKGGSSELEKRAGSGQPESFAIPATGNMSSCAGHYLAAGLLPVTQYRFRLRDCDAVTCSLWSNPYVTTTGAVSASTPTAQLSLSNGASLGSVSLSVGGGFTTGVIIPSGMPPGNYDIRAVAGSAQASTEIQITGSGASPSTLLVTGQFFGDVGCPMRPAGPSIPAARQFSLYGSGFSAGSVSIRLNTSSGPLLGFATVGGNGTFCSMFNGPAFNFVGDQSLVAIQNGANRTTLPVKVVIVRDPA